MARDLGFLPERLLLPHATSVSGSRRNPAPGRDLEIIRRRRRHRALPAGLRPGGAAIDHSAATAPWA